MGFRIFALIFLVVGLVHDYKRDKGQNVKAKVFHAACLTVLIFGYADSFNILRMLIWNFDGIKEHFSTDLGLISGQIHWFIYLAHPAIAIIILTLAYQMIRRVDKSRMLLVKLLPWAGLIEVFGFYRGWIGAEDSFEVNHGIIILIGLLFFGGIAMFIILVYNSGFMKVFFAIGQLGKTNTTDTVEVDRNEQ